MKKIIFCLMATFLSLTFMPVQLNAAVAEPVSSTTAPRTEVPAEVQTMLNRLDEIDGMDKSKLNSSEKKDLRKEVKSMNKQIKETDGVYLSGGVILLIIIILILL